MSKTLKTIQTLSKIGKIVSKIVFICCIVGFVACLVSLVLGVGTGELVRLGGVSIRGILEEQAGISVGTVYAATAVGLLLCAGEAVVAKYAELYFKHELQAGTPFTMDGAGELLRLGILTIVIPLAATVAASVTYEILAQYLPDVADFQMENGGSVGTGILFIIMSLLCRLGAEQKENA